MALNDFRAVYLPYCIKKQSDGSYLVLNREYQPLSFKPSHPSKYNGDYLNQELPIFLKIQGLTKARITKLVRLGARIQNEGKDIFLYNDGTNPVKKSNRENYYKMLDELMALKVL